MLNKASNNLIKLLKKQKHENSSLLFLDNKKIIKDALKSGLEAKCILTCDEKLIDFEEINCPAFLVDKKTISALSDSKTPQGVVCLIDYPQHVVEKPKTNFLVLDGLQDPGNVGTLIRTASAAGFNYVYLVSSVNPTNSKLIRSSVGTIFTNNVMSLTKSEFIKLVKKWNLFLIASDMNGKNIFDFSCPKDKNVGIVIGNEGQGVSEDISSLCKETVKIPMKKEVESLNASISGAIIMYQLNKDSIN